jgi:hypothetical protein
MAHESNNTGIEMDGLRYRGFFALIVADNLTFIADDTYYAIPGVFTDAGLSYKFTSGVDGTLTYNGEDGVIRVDGTSDVSIDSATVVHVSYILYKNGSPILGTETPHGFSNQSRTENISITGLIDVENGDIFQVFAKCDVAGKIMAIETLNVVLQKI